MSSLQIVFIMAVCAAVQAFKSSMRRGSMVGLQMSSTSKTPVSNKSYRIFNAGSLPDLLNPASEEEVKQLGKIQDILMKAGLEGNDKDDGLISTHASTGEAGSLASKLVQGMLQNLKQTGESESEAPSISSSMVVWAEKTDTLHEGVILLNHWAQRAILLTNYDPAKGAKGFDLNSLTIAGPGDVSPAARAQFTHSWPPLALEMELVDKKWQVAEVSANIANQSIFKFVPEEVKNAPTFVWELIFLLLLSDEEVADKAVIQALLDTGICPQKGLISYIRLFKRVSDRSKVINDAPTYRRISSDEFN